MGRFMTLRLQKIFVISLRWLDCECLCIFILLGMQLERRSFKGDLSHRLNIVVNALSRVFRILLRGKMHFILHVFEIISG